MDKTQHLPRSGSYEGGIGTRFYVSDYARPLERAYGGCDAYRDRAEVPGLPEELEHVPSVRDRRDGRAMRPAGWGKSER